MVSAPPPVAASNLNTGGGGTPAGGGGATPPVYVGAGFSPFNVASNSSKVLVPFGFQSKPSLKLALTYSYNVFNDLMNKSYHFEFSATFYCLTLSPLYSAGSMAPSNTNYGVSLTIQKIELIPSRTTFT